MLKYLKHMFIEIQLPKSHGSDHRIMQPLFRSPKQAGRREL